jgi:hypothetical protein
MTVPAVREALSVAQLEAIAALWRRDRRTLITSFNGTSMLPAIAPAQEVVVDCGSEAAVGEVIVFRFNNQVLVHRVVASAPEWLLTWGDANRLPDEPIEPSRAIGSVRNAPLAPRSRYRAILLWLLISPHMSIETLKRRVRFLLKIRMACSMNPFALARRIYRAVVRRLLLL